jgi:hypothetical protein
MFFGKCDNKECDNKAKFKTTAPWAYAHGGEVLYLRFCSEECLQKELKG